MILGLMQVDHSHWPIDKHDENSPETKQPRLDHREDLAPGVSCLKGRPQAAAVLVHRHGQLAILHLACGRMVGWSLGWLASAKKIGDKLNKNKPGTKLGTFLVFTNTHV